MNDDDELRAAHEDLNNALAEWHALNRELARLDRLRRRSLRIGFWGGVFTAAWCLVWLTWNLFHHNWWWLSAFYLVLFAVNGHFVAVNLRLRREYRAEHGH